MEITRYRIVFRGEVGLGYDSHEIRENLIRLTRWDAKKVDLLLDSSYCVIKSDLDSAAASRMLNALNATGIICQREEIPETVTAVNTDSSLPVAGRATIGVADTSAAKCPKCGVAQEGGVSCSTCGVIFAKLAQQREQEEIKPVTVATKVAAPYATVSKRKAKQRDDPLYRLEEDHPLGFYLGKIIFAIVAALLLRSLYHADMTLLIIILLPLAFGLYLGALSAVTERPFGEIFAEHISLLPVVSSDRERNENPLPFTTYGLIFLHTLVYFLWQLATPVDTLKTSWFFLPVDTSGFQLIVSAIASLFMHGSGFYFLASLFLLWVVGATLERRIGSALLLLFYLLSGLVAAGIGVGIQALFPPPETLQFIGAGGAIAGLIGVFAIRCRLRCMSFPLPFFGIDALMTGATYKVRWSSLLIISTLFIANPGEPIGGENTGTFGIYVLLGGMIFGLISAHLFGLGQEAGMEEEETSEGGQVFAANEKALRNRLEKHPDNPELQVQLARVIADNELTDEARKLYRRAIMARIVSKPREATEIYREFNQRHQEIFEPKLTLRLVSLYLRQGENEMAANLLHAVCDDPQATRQEREKSLYQYAATISTLGQIDEAHGVLKRFSDEFPESTMLQKLRDLIYDAAQKGNE